MSNSEQVLQRVLREMSLYVPSILLIFGSCGCLCNFVTFTSKQLKQSSCAFYFLCTALIELPTFYFGLLSRLAIDRMGSTLFATNLIYCKIRSYLIVALPATITYMILLTVIDRYMSTKTQVSYRSFSQLKVAYRLLPIIITISLLLPSHMLIFYDFYPSCTAQPGLYAILYSVYLILLTAILPNGLILVFSLLTYRNAQQAKQRIAPSSTTQQRRLQRTESQLIAMMLGQAIISSTLDFFRIALYAYFVLTTNSPKSSYHRLVDGLLLQISIILLYSNCSKSFYVYTLSSAYFRRIFVQKVSSYYKRIRHWIYPNEQIDLNSSQTVPSQFNRGATTLATRNPENN